MKALQQLGFFIQVSTHITRQILVLVVAVVVVVVVVAVVVIIAVTGVVFVVVVVVVVVVFVVVCLAVACTGVVVVTVPFPGVDSMQYQQMTLETLRQNQFSTHLARFTITINDVFIVALQNTV